MQPAKYPAKKCREPVFGASGIGYWCELPMMHTGPCASLSDAAGVARRDAWEAEHPDQVGRSTFGGDIVVDAQGRPL